MIFAVVLFIILLVPVTLKKSGIPVIVGLIFAGIIIGPFGFNLIEKNDTIRLFSEVGLLYIMFLAGLEIEFSEVRKNSLQAISFGLLTFMLPFAGGFAAAHYLFDFEIIASTLIGIMLASNTLIALPAASKLGLGKSRAVMTAISGTILADTLVLVILAFLIALMSGGESDWFILIFIGKLVGFSAVVFYVFPKISRWFFKAIANDGSLQYIYTLTILFISSYGAELIGAEPIIGAFFAGVALNPLIPTNSTLMNRIDFVGNSLFIPFFLLSVGMLVNLKILSEDTEALLYAGILILIAVGGKWLAAWVNRIGFRTTYFEMQTLFGLTTARAAATLAIVIVGVNYNVFGDDIFNATILLILASSLISSSVTERYGKRLLKDEADKLPQRAELESNRFLVPIANPKNIEKLIDLAILLKDQKSRSPIYPLAIVKDDHEVETRLAKHQPILERIAKQSAASDVSVQGITRVDVNIPTAIARASVELGVSDIILGWSGKSSKEISKFFGNMLDMILSNTQTTVIVSHLIHPCNITKEIIILIPQHAELESGYRHWIQLIKQLASQLTASLHLYLASDASVELEQSLKEAFKGHKTKMNRVTKKDSLEDIPLMGEKQMMVVINARKHAISYTPVFYQLTYQLHPSFSESNLLSIYPRQFS